MITIQNGKLLIPDNDRFVGFAGDNTVNSKQFCLTDDVSESCTYALCLRFDDDTVRTVPLTATTEDDTTVLTWEIRRDHLHASGIVQAQVKAVDSDGSIRHTTKDFFLVGSAVELDDSGSEAEYVTPSQLRDILNEALSKIAVTSPYVDEDGYWCVYDPESGEYRRTDYHVSGIAPDSAMSDSSDNAVSNRVIKRYVDDKATDNNTFAVSYTDLKTADKVPNTRMIARLPLSSDIDAADLMAALRPKLYKTNVTPNSAGIKGQIGIGFAGEVFFCIETDRWVHLINYEDLYDKMDLITEVTPAEAEDMLEGSLYFCSDVLYVRFDGQNIALSQAADVYNKSEIDAMIGDIESLLQAV